MSRLLPAKDIQSVNLALDVPHPARMYDYYLGGKDNFPADRDAAESVIAAAPNIRIMARENRGFMARAVAFLATEYGVEQFLDIGTGIPTSPNLHELVQTIAPESRVVYTDNDPLVLAHARALLTGTPQGRTAYLDADLRDPDRILSSAEVQGTLDLSRPVALSLLAILHFIPDDDEPYRIVRTLLDGLPSGSFLLLSHGTSDFDEAVRDAGRAYQARGLKAAVRTRAEINQFFDGLHLLDPGLRPVHQWRPAGPSALPDAEVSVYGALAQKA